MPDRKTCGDCRFYKPRPSCYDPLGECRRHAPQVMVTINQDDDFKSIDSYSWSAWPECKEDDWCGDFAPKDEATS